MKANTFRTLGFTSADAGRPVAPGRPGAARRRTADQPGAVRVSSTTPFRFTLQNSIILDQFLYPGVARSQPRQHQRGQSSRRWALAFRLKASVNIAQLNPESRVIAQAMQDYGMIVADKRQQTSSSRGPATPSVPAII